VALLYTDVIRPFPYHAFRALIAGCQPAVAVVEPYLAGTSVACLAEALSDIPHRLLGLGVGRREVRSYGTSQQHAIAHGLDSAGLRRRLEGFFANAPFSRGDGCW
jgi:transketolase